LRNDFTTTFCEIRLRLERRVPAGDQPRISTEKFELCSNELCCNSGGVLVFFGGSFTATLAAAEAFRVSGGDRVLLHPHTLNS